MWAVQGSRADTHAHRDRPTRLDTAVGRRAGTRQAETGRCGRALQAAVLVGLDHETSSQSRDGRRPGVELCPATDSESQSGIQWTEWRCLAAQQRDSGSNVPFIVIDFIHVTPMTTK